MELADILLIPVRVTLATVLFIISPLTALLSYFFDLSVSVLKLPVWVAQKLEVIYIYLGAAFLVGISIGIIFSFFSSAIFSALGIDKKPSPPRTPATARRKLRSKSPISPTVTQSEKKSSFTIPRERGWLEGGSGSGAGGRLGMGMGAVDISPLSPTSISPSLGLSGGGSGELQLGRQRIFPILEEEDEHEDEMRGRKGRGRGRRRV
ncbi:hypothetical protein TWF694_007405 [Orbilia ellipsospora]|uniref:Uncharacterized protein n=1 Tax=Orbilia ellipsospora TaxID=2528407 RepID=A0AAV9XII3_9PEZI